MGAVTKFWACTRILLQLPFDARIITLKEQKMIFIKEDLTFVLINGISCCSFATGEQADKMLLDRMLKVMK